ncbi:hypothetical protein CC78DRAFT_578177 [Lojkania enalia]|uniref:Uncharacterized protein n=1 Tax=Lojkania enalia TaxID=147567 RepID=A0A9P4KD53_9PLEO|nr:hypothetical protein CC78DRAFT_578177 [Didymosphaeria enalia]
MAIFFSMTALSTSQNPEQPARKPVLRSTMRKTSNGHRKLYARSKSPSSKWRNRLHRRSTPPQETRQQTIRHLDLLGSNHRDPSVLPPHVNPRDPAQLHSHIAARAAVGQPIENFRPRIIGPDGADALPHSETRHPPEMPIEMPDPATYIPRTLPTLSHPHARVSQQSALRNAPRSRAPHTPQETWEYYASSPPPPAYATERPRAMSPPPPYSILPPTPASSRRARIRNVLPRNGHHRGVRISVDDCDLVF